ncbi:MAG: peptidylprolyl isomerase [Candidatus Poseidoniales archaeon]|nr:MAG: peptidylprolyl isomerase [Candidatus Poseidoniales archaeon]
MEEGTIVHVDYELYNNESGDLIETTREDVAKEQEMHQEGRSYSPMVCVVGGGNLIPGFEAALADAKANKEIEVVIEAADAYGEKDPEQIETISIDKLIRAVKDPNSLYIGAPVNIGNRQGYLSYLAAGRARVDYNHPMAGKTLKYSFKVVKVVEGKEEQVLALLESNTGHSDFGVAFDGDDLNITIPQTMLFDTNAAMMKFRLVTIIRDAVDCGKVSFIEVHEPRGFGLDAEDEEEAADEGEDLSKLSVAELKERLKAAGLPVGGKKADLIARLSQEEE